MAKWYLVACPTICAAFAVYAAALSGTTTEKCTSIGELRFLCGIKKPEDLAPLPGGRWIVASGMEPRSGLHLIDAQAKRWIRWKFAAPTSTPLPPFDQCAAAPANDELQAHGLSLRSKHNGSAILYVVNHGGAQAISDFAVGGPRETIEVFNVQLTGPRPTLTWAGCLPLPPGLMANSVSSAPDGSVFATVLLHPGNRLSDLWQGKITGAVYKWARDSDSFKKIIGTEQTGNNGVEVSRDGSKIYVSSFSRISMFSNENPARLIESVGIPHGIGDNIHWVGDRLIVSGVKLKAGTNGSDGTREPDGYYVASVNPRNLRLRMIAEGPYRSAFDGISVGIPVGDTLWLGSHSADRIGYRHLEKRSGVRSLK